MSKKASNKKKTKEEFIKEFREKFPEKDYYDLSGIDYIDSSSTITIYCKKHSKYFEIRACNLLGGITSCPDCKKELTKLNSERVKNRGKESFNKFLQENFSDIYDYNIDEYNGSHSKMTFINKSTGEKKQYTPSDLRSYFKHKGEKRSHNSNWAKDKIKEEGKKLIKLINDNFPDIDTTLVNYTGDRKKILLICRKHPDESPFEIAPYTIKLRIEKGQELCDLCNREVILKNRTKEFVEEYNRRYPNNHYNFSETIYESFHKPITVFCNIHKIFFTVRPFEFLYEGTMGCPKCGLEHYSMITRKSEGEKFIKYMNENYPDIDTSFIEYIDVNTPVVLRCKIHDIKFKLSPWKIKYVIPKQKCTKLCPECRDLEKWGRVSKLESLVSISLRDLLGISNPESQIEMSAESMDIKDERIKSIRADFLIEYNNVRYWIETNGQQHYEPVYYFQRTVDEYKRQLDRDTYVREYCKENNIVLIEIPYTYDTLEKIENILQLVIIDSKDPVDIIDYPDILPIESYKEEEGDKYERR